MPYRSCFAVIALTVTLAAAATTVHATGRDTGNRREAVQRLRERFTGADVDHDGYLSRDEAVRGMPRLGDRFDAIDADHDGRVTLVEIVRYLAQKRRSN